MKIGWQKIRKEGNIFSLKYTSQLKSTIVDESHSNALENLKSEMKL